MSSLGSTIGPTKITQTCPPCMSCKEVHYECIDAEKWMASRPSSACCTPPIVSWRHPESFSCVTTFVGSYKMDPSAFGGARNYILVAPPSTIAGSMVQRNQNVHDHWSASAVERKWFRRGGSLKQDFIFKECVLPVGLRFLFGQSPVPVVFVLPKRAPREVP